MTALRQLAVVEGVGALALLAVAGALGGFGMVADGGRFSPAYGLLFFVYALILGAPFVALYGAPAYWALLRYHKATWWAALALGVAPGVLMLPMSWGLGAWYAGCGSAVALLTHWYCRRLPPAQQENAVRGTA